MNRITSTNAKLRRKTLNEIYGILDEHTNTGRLEHEQIEQLKFLLDYGKKPISKIEARISYDVGIER